MGPGQHGGNNYEAAACRENFTMFDIFYMFIFHVGRQPRLPRSHPCQRRNSTHGRAPSKRLPKRLLHRSVGPEQFCTRPRAQAAGALWCRRWRLCRADHCCLWRPRRG